MPLLCIPNGLILPLGYFLIYVGIKLSLVIAGEAPMSHSPIASAEVTGSPFSLFYLSKAKNCDFLFFISKALSAGLVYNS